MIKRLAFVCVLTLQLAFLAPVAPANDDIPKAAWKRPIGEPLQNPGTKKPTQEVA